MLLHHTLAVVIKTTRTTATMEINSSRLLASAVDRLSICRLRGYQGHRQHLGPLARQGVSAAAIPHHQGVSAVATPHHQEVSAAAHHQVALVAATPQHPGASAAATHRQWEEEGCMGPHQLRPCGL